METFSGISNWKLTVRREPDGVTLLQCLTCDISAALPDSLWGLPVVALSHHALAPGHPVPDGESVQITCGTPPESGWDNGRLRELSLPSSLRRAGEYALFNCRALKTLSLHDNGILWGSAALMNCRELDTLSVIQDHGDRGAVAWFAGELNRELDVTVFRSGAAALRLVFPAYREFYEENCPAHHFDYVIEGAGYPYHHCFHQKRLDLLEYDRLWETQKNAMESDTALRLAWRRLRYPDALPDGAAGRYLDFLRDHIGAAADWRIRERDAAGLSFLLDRLQPDRDTLSRAAALAREQGFTEAIALLLEARRQLSAAPRQDRFAL